MNSDLPMKYCYSPHLCVGFLFFVLHSRPPARSTALLTHYFVTHSSFPHFLTHNLLTQLTIHTFVTQLFPTHIVTHTTLTLNACKKRKNPESLVSLLGGEGKSMLLSFKVFSYFGKTTSLSCHSRIYCVGSHWSWLTHRHSHFAWPRPGQAN